MDAELALSNLSVCNRVFAKSKGCVITVAVDAATHGRSLDAGTPSRASLNENRDEIVSGFRARSDVAVFFFLPSSEFRQTGTADVASATLPGAHRASRRARVGRSAPLF